VSAFAVLATVLAPAAAHAVTVDPVRFTSGDVRVSGDVVLPDGPGPHPAVVMLHGSGREDRSGYRIVARALAERGVAALIYDKRGAGESSGDADYRYSELVADGQAALSALVARPDVQDDGVGVWGLSEGGFIAPMIAARDRRVAAVVVVSPSGLRPVDQQQWAVRRGLHDSGSTPLGARPVARFYRIAVAARKSRMSSWLPRRLLDVTFDPTETWTRVGQPVLALFGAADHLVPIRASQRAIRAALAAGANRDRTFRTYAGAAHDLHVSVRAGQPVYADGYFDDLARWLRPRLAGSARSRVDASVTAGHDIIRPQRVEAGWTDSIAAQSALLLTPLLLMSVALARRMSAGRTACLAAALGFAAVTLTALGTASIVSVDGRGVDVVLGYPLILLPAAAATTVGWATVLVACVRRWRGRSSSVAPVAVAIPWLLWAAIWLLDPG
jgi:uncharacterized protein